MRRYARLEIRAREGQLEDLGELVVADDLVGRACSKAGWAVFNVLGREDHGFAVCRDLLERVPIDEAFDVELPDDRDLPRPA